MEHPTATEHVSMWINNDSDYHESALEIAKDGALHLLEVYCLERIRGAAPQTAPWFVFRRHSPDELDAVDWAEVARDLTTE